MNDFSAPYSRNDKLKVDAMNSTLDYPSAQTSFHICTFTAS